MQLSSGVQGHSGPLLHAIYLQFHHPSSLSILTSHRTKWRWSTHALQEAGGDCEMGHGQDLASMNKYPVACLPETVPNSFHIPKMQLNYDLTNRPINYVKALIIPSHVNDWIYYLEIKHGTSESFWDTSCMNHIIITSPLPLEFCEYCNYNQASLSFNWLVLGRFTSPRVMSSFWAIKKH